MYLPSHFREDRIEVQHELIRSHPLGTLVTAGPDGLAANLLPFLVYPQEGELGTLRAHFARANPQGAQLAQVKDCLVVFNGPQGYITPSWYPGKQETGKVVPTWNFVTVHAWGAPRLIEDPVWLRRQLEDLTDAQEEGHTQPWKVSDAPQGYIDAQVRGIVGLEIPIRRIEGKWKLSQNRSPAERTGVIQGLSAQGPGDQALAELVAQRSPAD